MVRSTSKAMMIVVCLLGLAACHVDPGGAGGTTHIATYIELFRGEAGANCEPVGAWYTAGVNCATGPAEVASATTVDAKQFPFFTTFRFEATALIATSSTFCWRLYDLTRAAPVAGTERCESNPDPNVGRNVRISSGALHLPAGPHDYVAQVKNEPGFLLRARLLSRSL
jgi:hypothetical protein